MYTETQNISATRLWARYLLCARLLLHPNCGSESSLHNPGIAPWYKTQNTRSAKLEVLPQPKARKTVLMGGFTHFWKGHENRLMAAELLLAELVEKSAVLEQMLKQHYWMLFSIYVGKYWVPCKIEITCLFGRFSLPHLIFMKPAFGQCTTFH